MSIWKALRRDTRGQGVNSGAILAIVLLILVVIALVFFMRGGDVEDDADLDVDVDLDDDVGMLQEQRPGAPIVAHADGRAWTIALEA